VEEPKSTLGARKIPGNIRSCKGTGIVYHVEFQG
jgi:hypothetical protein